MRVVLPLLSLPILIWAGCANSAANTSPQTLENIGSPAQRLALAPGSILRLSELVAGEFAQAGLVNALLREALRQSAKLDFAAGLEDARVGDRILVHWDKATQRLATTLSRGDQPELPLHSVVVAAAGDSLWQAVDALAAGSRAALADTAPGLPCAKIYSSQAACIEATEAALQAIAEGQLQSAMTQLRRARTADPGCTLTQALMAEVQSDLGASADSLKTATQALALSERLAPTTAFRLQRTALWNRGRSSAPLPRELQQLAVQGASERPYDPHVRFCAALSQNLAGEFALAREALQAMADRWPKSGSVAYHLAFAQLGCGDPAAALTTLERTPGLQRHAVLLPRSLALLGQKRHVELAADLEAMAADPTVLRSALLHEVRRMQAAHALLQGQERIAVTALLNDLEWIRQRPSKLSELALDVAEQGEVLVRLGHAQELAVRLRAFEELGNLAPAFTVVLTYLSGLVDLASDRDAQTAHASLERERQTVFAGMLRAAQHQRRGELQDESRELRQLLQAADNPMAIAAYGRTLRLAGHSDEAQAVFTALRRELAKIDLLAPRNHILTSPGRALAWLATEPR